MFPFRLTSGEFAAFHCRGDRKGERSERCQRQNKRGERVAVVDRCQGALPPQADVGYHNRVAPTRFETLSAFQTTIYRTTHNRRTNICHQTPQTTEMWIPSLVMGKLLHFDGK